MTIWRVEDFRAFFTECARLTSAAACAALCSAAALSVEGQVLSINVGSQTLPANSSSATLAFTIASGSSSSVSGLNFNIQVGSGTPGLTPTITGIELISGSPFASVSSTQQPNGSQPPDQKAAFWNVTTPGSPPANITVGTGNRVALVTFSTLNVSSGSWNLLLDNTDNGPTTYLDSNGDPILTSVTDGTLTIVPEPGTYAAVAGLGCLGFGFVLRRSRTKAS